MAEAAAKPPVDPAAALAALSGVAPQGKEMARALMWLVDECISGVALELQQEARAGTLSLEGEACHVVRDAAAPDEPALEALKKEGLALRSPMYCDTRGDIATKPGYDCFGQPLVSISGDKSTETIACPNCGQKTGAARFAPHLQRCMGGGRNASTSRRSTTPNGNGNGNGRNSAEPRDGIQRVGSGSKLARAPTPPVNSAFSAGAAGAVLSEKLRRKSASPTNKDAGGKEKTPADKSGGSVATAKHQQALAIANAAVRGGMGADGSSPKAARTSQ